MQFFIIFFFLFLSQCIRQMDGQPEESIATNELMVNRSDKKISSNHSMDFNENNPIEIQCDTIYPEKAITIQLWTDDSNRYYDGPNSEFVLKKAKKVIYRDSIYSATQRIEIQDYNRDGVDDILIQQYSDVRSNWTYNLYLIDPISYKPEHIIEFSQIKNPRLNETKDTITSYVISGDIYYEEFVLTKANDIVQVGDTVMTGDPR